MIDWQNDPAKRADGGAAPAPRRRLYVPLGRVLATPGALETLAVARVDGATYLARHAAGDWGDVDADDWSANDRALGAGERLLSAYRLPNGERLWIITEADRSASTLLRPDEY
jgi:hypothetical protein